MSHDSKTVPVQKKRFNCLYYRLIFLCVQAQHFQPQSKFTLFAFHIDDLCQYSNKYIIRLAEWSFIAEC